MKINFSPVTYDHRDTNTLAPLELSRAGDTLTVSGQALDFSVIPDGAVLPDAAQATGCQYFIGSIERDSDGVLSMTLILPQGPTASEGARFPVAIEVAQDGPVALPETGWPLPEELETETATGQEIPISIEEQGGQDGN